jgi:hypothetical protein
MLTMMFSMTTNICGADPQVDAFYNCCPECEAKVWWACQSDPVKRYAGLVEFAKAHQLMDEAAHWERSRLALMASPTIPKPVNP